MNRTFSSLAGDTSTFALRLSFEDDPDAGSAAPPDESISWGSFELWVQGQNLCAHRELGESSSTCSWYLLPLLEWFVGNWEPLLHEERLPGEVAGLNAAESFQKTSRASSLEFAMNLGCETEREEDWWMRHCLLSCREGAIYPNVFFRRLAHSTEVSWLNDPVLAGQPEHFRFDSQRGSARLVPHQVSEVLHVVFSRSIEFLSKKMPDSQRIIALHQRLDQLRSYRIRVPPEDVGHGGPLGTRSS
jgi:hypothetical protein